MKGVDVVGVKGLVHDFEALKKKRQANPVEGGRLIQGVGGLR